MSLVQGCLSVVLGLVTSYILTYFRPQNLHGPDSNQIKQQTHYDEITKQCYRYVPQPYICPLSRAHV